MSQDNTYRNCDLCKYLMTCKGKKKSSLARYKRCVLSRPFEAPTLKEEDEELALRSTLAESEQEEDYSIPCDDCDDAKMPYAERRCEECPYHVRVVEKKSQRGDTELDAWKWDMYGE